MRFCPFSIPSGRYAWINEQIPWDYANDDDQVTSQFQGKMLNAECRNASALTQNLLPGRECFAHFQCASSYCDEGVCAGSVLNEQCAENEDCMAGLFCSSTDTWPYRSTCVLQHDEGEACSTDYECKNHQFCWYENSANVQSDDKTCMNLYS